MLNPQLAALLQQSGMWPMSGDHRGLSWLMNSQPGLQRTPDMRGTLPMGAQIMGGTVTPMTNTNPGMPGMMTPGQRKESGIFTPQMTPPQQPGMIGGGFTGGRENPHRMMLRSMGGK